REWSVLARQCLARRIPDHATLAREAAAWTEARNADRVGIDWRFTMVDARARLPFLYPDPSETQH
ncbi:MAG: IS630 family transposase, partial [Thermomicrobiales bacterium]|nr:IS630 family transposase [Thermomicrobiales bacterium]